MPANSSPLRTRWPWFLLLAAMFAGVGAFFVPAFIIRPFRYQDPRALWWAMAIRQRAPLASLVCAVICLLLVAILWRAATRWGKAALIAAMALSAAAAAMSRQNYFEWMFHPVDSPQFASAALTKLADGEMIMAVRFGADARAYPIREMAYHHILNDVVGGVPVAVTY